MRCRLLYIPLVSLLSLGVLSCSGDSNGGGGGGACASITDYTPSSTTPLSYATDVHPILSNTTLATGCSQAAVCHGPPLAFVDAAETRTLSLVDAPATVRAALLQPSFNVPNMPLVTPGNVGQSFLAYKLSSREVLDCVAPRCTGGPANTPTGATCGDPMPIGSPSFTAADRTKILDWIATGAGE